MREKAGKHSWKRKAAYLVLLLAAACAGLQRPVPVGPGIGEKTIDMTASSYRFTPNNIKAQLGDTLILKVKNTAHIEHNITVHDPENYEVLSVYLPPGQTREVKIKLDHTGRYYFFCRIAFHEMLGMFGQITVTAAR
ncbi:MAG: cupredoxin domain-containing protein [Nitrospiraceae bacterium]|nr:cupredoxin domain-containing protein [Nitrospiraceae bacterium]